MTKAAPVRSLTIFLMKAGIKESDILDDEASEDCEEVDIRLDSKSVGTLYAKQTPITPPSWLKFFAGSAAKNPKLSRASVSAVYITRAGGRLFGIVFGQGRHLLKGGSYEERFGLRVTLNSVDPKSLRAVDVSTLDANPFHGTRQASREATLGEFGINLDQDILRAVAGRPLEEKLGRRMAGVDSLSVRVRVDLATLPGLLKRYLQKSEDVGYRENFRWVDHVAEVRDTLLEERLFRELIQVIDKNKGGVWAAIPERVEWTNFDSFRFGSMTKGRPYDDITLDRMLECLDGEPVSLEFLQKESVYCLAEDNPYPIHKWSFLKCLTAELNHDGSMYLLNAGKWYRVSTDFVEEIKRDLDSLLPASSPTLPVWGDEHEDAYNARVSGDSGGHLVLMDRVMISHPGMASPIEFCDLFSDERRLIHVKRYGQSSILSHLFMQGLVSANSLLSDAQFRLAVNKHLPPSHELADPNSRPLPSAYEVVFAIGSSEVGSLKLPFFSRVTLRNVIRSLTQSFGYRASLTKIRVDKFAQIGSTKTTTTRTGLQPRQ
jgi:uncharacterized protein (TIGR04141 family)